VVFRSQLLKEGGFQEPAPERGWLSGASS